MSGWTVYWVMQADAIRESIFGLAMVTGTGSAMALFVGLMLLSCPYGNDGQESFGRRVIWHALHWISPLCVLSALSLAFIPSTKTLCAVIAVPMVVNNETLQADSAEIYKLGMERLKEELGSDALQEQVERN
jgi:hypothetical protein